LVAASLAKTEQLWTEGMPERTLDSWGLVALTEMELALGWALLSNISPQLVRWIALVLFGAFTCVALSRTAGGASSCSCAGNLQISPMLAVAVDVCILAALWRWRPASRPVRTWLMAALSVGLLAVTPWPLLAAFRPAPYPRLVVTPVIDLGQLAPGERREFTLGVRNPHDQPVEIAALESSCPWLQSKGLPSRVAPGEQQSLDMTLDLSREPGFAGPLSVAVTGRTTTGEIAFVTEVGIRVHGKK